MEKVRFSAVGLFLALSAAGSISSAFAGGFIDQLVQQKIAERLRAQDQLFAPFSLMNFAKDDDEIGAPWAPSEPVMGQTSGTFNQKIDPSNPQDTRTFAQRYFINSSYASGPNPPVFYYICGEAACGAPSGAALGYARQYHGYVVALEHRYYGTSQPFPTLSPANLKYLKTEYALADLATFENFAQSQLGLKGKWISIGGSYSGSLSAYYRLRYPTLVVGALASSGPVQARDNFEAYDWVVNDRAGPQCANAIRGVVAKLESAMRSDAKAFAAAKHQFQCDNVTDPVDFLYIVADMAAAAVQYGMKDEFCAAVVNGSADPVGAYAKAGIAAFARLGETPEEDSFMAAKNEDPNAYASGVGMRQWLYQSCTEYGYFQNAYHDPSQSTRSALINPDFHHRVCQELFGVPTLDTTKITKYFYQPLLNSSTTRILFTNGSIDPWATLSISQENGNNTNPNLATNTIAGAAHCDDLRSLGSSATPVGKAQQIFMGLVNQWLQ